MSELIVPACQLQGIKSTTDGGWRFFFDCDGEKDSGLIMAALSLLRGKNLALTVKDAE